MGQGVSDSEALNGSNRIPLLGSVDFRAAMHQPLVRFSPATAALWSVTVHCPLAR